MGFWIFLSVYVVCEAWLYSQGHDTVFFSHRTVHEKALRRQQTGVNENQERAEEELRAKNKWWKRKSNT